MRISISIALFSLLFAACDQAESARTVEYVADGSASSIDVAFIAPRGVPTATDTTFVTGDSTFVRNDTTFVLNVQPPWSLQFDAEDGQDLFLRSTNRTESGHVSAIIYVDGRFYASDGSGDSLKAASCGGTL